MSSCRRGFMEDATKAWFQGCSSHLIKSLGFHASPGEKGRPRPHYISNSMCVFRAGFRASRFGHMFACYTYYRSGSRPGWPGKQDLREIVSL